MRFEPSTSDFSPVPMGKYPATVAAFEMVEDKFNEGGQRIRWSFDLGEVETLEGEVKPVELTAWTSTKVSNSKSYGPSNLWRLAEAAGLDPSQGVDTDDLIGRKVVLIVIEEPRKDGAGIFSKVEGYQAPRAATNGKANGATSKAPAAKRVPHRAPTDETGYDVDDLDDQGLPF